MTRPRRIHFAAATLVLVMLVLIAGSATAIATGLFSDVFRIGNVSAVASRPVSLGEARVTGLPLPTSDAIGTGWKIRQVYLTRTPTWSSVDVQYSRPGSVGMGIKVTSDPIGAPAEGTEILSVSGTDVVVRHERDSRTGEMASVWARFAHQGSAVEIRGSARELDRGEIATVVTDWIRQAHK